MQPSMLLSILLMPGTCTGLPKDVTRVDDFGFDVNSYLGKWYEIARLDHSFERGLDEVTAEYALRDDGGIRVTKRSFGTADNKWQDIEGKA